MRRHFDPEPPALPDPATFIKTATIVVDTNALLEPYRYSVDARDAALNALEAVQGRLWMPHQVGVEFFRHHEGYRSALTQAYDQALVVLEEARKGVREVFGTGKKFQESRQAVGKRADGSLNRLKTTLGRLRATDEAIVDEDDDPVLDRLTELYGDRWGSKPDPLTFRERVEDFHQWRLPNQIPPGFRDIETKTHPTRAAGDYLIWAEVLEHAARSGCDVLLVTNDSKSDWWEQVPGARPRPRRELVEEFAAQTGHAYHQLSFREFITTTETVYGVSVGAGVVEEIAEIEEEDARRRVLTAESIRSLIDSWDARAIEQDRVLSLIDSLGELPASQLAAYNIPEDRVLRLIDSIGMLPAPQLAAFEAPYESVRNVINSIGALSPSQLAAFETLQDTARKTNGSIGALPDVEAEGQTGGGAALNDAEPDDE